MKESNMLKVHVITQNEPFYIPKMLKELLSNQGADYIIKSYTVLHPSRKNKNIYHWFKERARIYNFKELFIVGSCFLFTKIVNLIFKSTYSSKKLLSKNSIEIQTKDINDAKYIESIKNIDVIISISCPQLFKSGLLNIAKFSCINAHGTLLPRHRGVFGSWWTLFEGDNVAGGTIHTMELKLDAGEILFQEEFQIADYDTQYSIAWKTKKLMATGLIQVLKIIKNNNVKYIDNKYQSSYHRSPSKELGKEFHKKGLRIITFKDAKKILMASF